MSLLSGSNEPFSVAWWGSMPVAAFVCSFMTAAGVTVLLTPLLVPFALPAWTR